MTARHAGPLALALALGLLVGCGGGDAPQASVPSFCTKVAPLADLGGQLASPEADLAALATQVRDLAAVAPPEIRPSVETIANAVTTFADAVKASGASGDEALAAGSAAIAGETAKLNQASQAVEDYTARECGIDLTPGDSDTEVDSSSVDETTGDGTGGG